MLELLSGNIVLQTEAFRFYADSSQGREDDILLSEYFENEPKLREFLIEDTWAVIKETLEIPLSLFICLANHLNERLVKENSNPPKNSHMERLTLLMLRQAGWQKIKIKNLKFKEFIVKMIKFNNEICILANKIIE